MLIVYALKLETFLWKDSRKTCTDFFQCLYTISKVESYQMILRAQVERYGSYTAVYGPIWIMVRSVFLRPIYGPYSGSHCSTWERRYPTDSSLLTSSFAHKQISMRLRKSQKNKCPWLIGRTLCSFYYISDLRHVCSTKVKLKSFDLKFGLQIDPTVIRIFWNFQKEQMRLSQDIRPSK